MMTRLRTFLMLGGSFLLLFESGLFADPKGENGANHLAQTAREAVITITASFPGANAEVVADLVAAPIEQQVIGVDDMVSLCSTSKSDGSYVAEVAALRKSAEDLINEKTPPATQKPKFQLTVPAGKLWMPDEILDQVLSKRDKGRVVRLKDVAKVELVRGKSQSQAIWNGQAAVCLAICSTNGAKCRDVGDQLKRRLRELEQHFPEGIRMDIPYDCTRNLVNSDKDHPSKYFAFDIDVLKRGSAEKGETILTRCNSLLLETKKVADILAITENPFDQTARHPWILLRLANSAEKQDAAPMAAFVREKLQQIDDARIRRPMTWIHHGFLGTGYPLAAALHGPDFGKVSQWAEKLLGEFNQEKKLIDAWIDPASLPSAQPCVEIDNSKLTARGIKAGDVADTIRVLSDVLRDHEVARFGPWPVVMQMDGKSGPPIDYLRIRDSQGKLISLAEFVTLRENNAPQTIHRVDLRQSIPITANTPPGVSLGDAQTYFAKVADRVRKELKMPASYGITWPTPLPF